MVVMVLVLKLEVWDHSPVLLFLVLWLWLWLWLGVVEELELVVGLLKQLLGYRHGEEVGELRHRRRRGMLVLV